MSYLYCNKNGQYHWDDRTLYDDEDDDGSFSLITKGPLNISGCRCDSCNRPLEIGEPVFLKETMLNPHSVQCSQAADYIDLRNAECRICDSADLTCHAPILFPPADTFPNHFNYVEQVYRNLQRSWNTDQSQDVADVLDTLLDPYDPHRKLWQILTKPGQEQEPWRPFGPFE
jgi:hypothetical protein